MSDLLLHLDAKFDDLVDTARALIPTEAPEWTDHNLHDPGIMLIELMAWNAEAQIYSMGRMRRDERRAYGALLGVPMRGPTPASGLIWPTALPPDQPPSPLGVGRVLIARDTSITPEGEQTPEFRLTHDISLTGAQLRRVQTVSANGEMRDWTAANEEDGVAFTPFGVEASPGDRLVLTFEGPLLPPSSLAKSALLSLGVRVATTLSTTPPMGDAPPDTNEKSRLRATLGDANDGVPLTSAADTTRGFLQTGVLLLRLESVPEQTTPQFVLTISPGRGGLLRAPVIDRISPNVLPVRQLQPIDEDLELPGTGLPNQRVVLGNAGICFGPGFADVQVEVEERSRFTKWRLVEEFTNTARDACFTADYEAPAVQFGNGINGRMPPAGAALRASYEVSEGARGNSPADRGWTVQGIAGVYGTNLDALTGGADALNLDDLRAEARGRLQTQRPLVTAGDLEEAARAQSDLGVARAVEITGQLIQAGAAIPRGNRTLVVTGVAGETSQWLEELRRRLAPRLTLGQGLRVVAPRYVDVHVNAKLATLLRHDPKTVAAEARAELIKRFATTGDTPWPFGRDVRLLDIKSWLRRVPGVARIVDATLSTPSKRGSYDELKIAGTGLPRLQLAEDAIAVERPPRGAAA